MKKPLANWKNWVSAWRSTCFMIPCFEFLQTVFNTKSIGKSGHPIDTNIIIRWCCERNGSKAGRSHTSNITHRCLVKRFIVPIGKSRFVFWIVLWPVYERIFYKAGRGCRFIHGRQYKECGIVKNRTLLLEWRGVENKSPEKRHRFIYGRGGGIINFCRRCSPEIPIRVGHQFSGRKTVGNESGKKSIYAASRLYIG